MRQLQHAVLLLVVHVALRAGQHGVVVDQAHAACSLLTELRRIDRANARDHAIGRRVLDQVLDRASLALRRKGQSAVFMEAALIKKLCDVLARSALPGGTPAGHRLRPVFIAQKGLSGDEFGEVWPDVIRVDGNRLHGLCFSRLVWLDEGDRLTCHQGDAGCGGQRANRAAALCADHMLHLHRLQHRHRLAGLNLLAWLDIQAHHGALLGRCDRHRAAWRRHRPGRMGCRRARHRARHHARHRARFAVRIQAGCRRRAMQQLDEPLIDETRVDLIGREIGMRQYRLEKSRIGRDALDAQLAQGPARLGHRVFVARRRAVHDQLGQQRVEGGAGAIAGIGKGIDANAGARGRLKDADQTAGGPRLPEFIHGLHVDAQLDRMALRTRHLTL